MFWIGQLIVLVSTLAWVALSRNAVRGRFPRVQEFHLDLVVLLLVPVGVALAIVDHVGQNRLIRELQSQHAYRPLSPEVRIQVVQELDKIRRSFAGRRLQVPI